VSYNNPHLLFLNLLSIREHADVAYEVVVVDNNSDSKTQSLLSRTQVARIARNQTNRGFPSACMQGVAISRGSYLCLLNNDALIEAKCFSSALRNFVADESTGAVGGKVIQPCGKLEEAGSILWCDGTTNGYGAGDDPNQLWYSFRRPVDYCSGAFLMTPRKLFNDLGGFDEVFSPGYYEDTDYCSRLWSRGYKVIYEPLCVIRHFGNASSADKGEALKHVIRNHELFYKRWKDKLAFHFEPRSENTHAAAVSASDDRMRTLAIFSKVPHAESNQKEWQSLQEFAAHGRVTCVTTENPPNELDYWDISREVEFVDATVGKGPVVRRLAEDYDFVWTETGRKLSDDLG
jgi:GT2 family glycosyltransferase